MKRLTSSIVLTLFLLINSFNAALATEKLVIPVFYVTDRILDTSSIDTDYTNSEEDDPKINYGIKNVVLVNPQITQETERISGLGWYSLLPDNLNASNPSLNYKNTTLNRDELFARLKETVKSGASNRPLVVYVNGCCQPFKSSVETAARVEAQLQAPVVLYAWAALPPTDKKYRENELREKSGLMRFGRFLEDLEQSVAPEQTVLIAHSMGNRFVHESMLHRYWNRGANPNLPTFREIILACADVNADDFVANEKEFARNSTETIITKNNFDPALTLSSIQRGFYKRLGAPVDSLKKLLTTDGVTVVDIERFYVGKHDLPLDIIEDLVRKDEGGHQTRFKLWQQKSHLTKVVDLN